MWADELHLGRSILCILWRLLHTSPAQVPEDDSPVITTTGQDTRVLWMPGDRGNDIFVALESMNLAMIRKSQIKHTNRPISRASREEYVVGWMKRQSIDRVTVSFYPDGWLVVGGFSQVYQCKSLVIRDTAEQILTMSRMELHIVHDITVMCECTSGR